MSESIQTATIQPAPDRSGTIERKLWLSPSVRVITSPDGAALLDVQAGTCLALNVTGLFIWERINSGQTEDEIVAALSRECDEPSENVRRGYAIFVDKLLEQHLAGLTPDGFSQARPSRQTLLARLKRVFGDSQKS